MRKTKTEGKFFRKSIAILLLISFTLLNIVVNPYPLSAEPLHGSILHHGINQADPRSVVDSLSLPEGLGTIREKYIPPHLNPLPLKGERRSNEANLPSPHLWGEGKGEGKNLPVVIYLESAHANLDSETNTREIINYLEKNHGLSLVLLEGGEGRLDSLFFKSFPDRGRKEKLLKEYLSQGDLSGGEVQSILDESSDIPYYGVETQDLYNQNKASFLKAVSQEEKIAKILDLLENELSEKAKTVANQNFLSFRTSFLSFHDEKEDLLQYLNTLKTLYVRHREASEAERRHCEGTQCPKQSSDPKIASSLPSEGTFKGILFSPDAGGVRASASPRNDFGTQFPELHTLLEAEENQKKMTPETHDALVTQVLNAFKERVLPRLSKEDSMKINSIFQDYQTQRLDQGTLLNEIDEYSDKAGLMFKIPEGLKEKAAESRKLSQIKGTKLFDELEHLEHALSELLPKTPEEKELSLRDRELLILKDLSKLELLPKDWEGLKLVCHSERSEESKILQPCGLQDDIAVLFKPHFEFYELANRRDEALFHNSLKLIEKEKAKVALLSTGGFHAKGITEQLKASRIPYILISPKITRLTDKSIYLAAMRDERSFMKDKTATSMWDALAKDYASKLASSLREDELTPSLKRWRDRIIQNSIAEGRITQAAQYTKYVDALIQALRKEYQQEKGTGNNSLPVPFSSEDQLKQALSRELDSFLNTYFNRLEQMIHQKLDVFSAGLKGLWERKDFSQKAIEDLFQSMNTLPKSNLAVALALIKNPGLDILPDGDLLRAVLPGERFKGEDQAEIARLGRELAQQFKDRPELISAARAELRVMGHPNPVMAELTRAGITDGGTAGRILDEASKLAVPSPEPGEVSAPFRSDARLPQEGTLGKGGDAWKNFTTDPARHEENTASFRYLVHGISDPLDIIMRTLSFKIAGTFKELPPDNVNLLEVPQHIARKKYISASLIQNSHDPRKAKAATFTPAGYILLPDSDNVIETHNDARDTATPFWADPASLPERLQNRSLMSPHELLDLSGSSTINEVLLTGQSPFDPLKQVKIVGVFIKVGPSGEELASEQVVLKLKEHAKKHGWPIIYIKEPPKPSFNELFAVKPARSEARNIDASQERLNKLRDIFSMIKTRWGIEKLPWEMTSSEFRALAGRGKIAPFGDNAMPEVSAVLGGQKPFVILSSHELINMRNKFAGRLAIYRASEEEGFVRLRDGDAYDSNTVYYAVLEGHEKNLVRQLSPEQEAFLNTIGRSQNRNDQITQIIRESIITGLWLGYSYADTLRYLNHRLTRHFSPRSVFEKIKILVSATGFQRSHQMLLAYAASEGLAQTARSEARADDPDKLNRREFLQNLIAKAMSANATINFLLQDNLIKMFLGLPQGLDQFSELIAYISTSGITDAQSVLGLYFNVGDEKSVFNVLDDLWQQQQGQEMITNLIQSEVNKSQDLIEKLSKTPSDQEKISTLSAYLNDMAAELTRRMSIVQSASAALSFLGELPSGSDQPDSFKRALEQLEQLRKLPFNDQRAVILHGVGKWLQNAKDFQNTALTVFEKASEHLNRTLSGQAKGMAEHGDMSLNLKDEELDKLLSSNAKEVGGKEEDFLGDFKDIPSELQSVEDSTSDIQDQRDKIFPADFQGRFIQIKHSTTKMHVVNDESKIQELIAHQDPSVKINLEIMELKENDDPTILAIELAKSIATQGFEGHVGIAVGMISNPGVAEKRFNEVISELNRLNPKLLLTFFYLDAHEVLQALKAFPFLRTRAIFFLSALRKWAHEKESRAVPIPYVPLVEHGIEDSMWDLLEEPFLDLDEDDQTIGGHSSVPPTKEELIEQLQSQDLTKFEQNFDPFKRDDILLVLNILAEIAKESREALSEGKQGVILQERARVIEKILHEQIIGFTLPNDEEVRSAYSKVALLLSEIDWYGVDADKFIERLSPSMRKQIITEMFDVPLMSEFGKAFLVVQNFLSDDPHKRGAGLSGLTGVSNSEAFKKFVTPGFLVQFNEFINQNRGLSDIVDLTMALGTMIRIREMLVGSEDNRIENMIRNYLIDLYHDDPALLRIAVSFFAGYSKAGLTDTQQVINRFKSIVDDGALDSETRAAAFEALRLNAIMVEPDFFDQYLSDEIRKKMPFKISVLDENEKRIVDIFMEKFSSDPLILFRVRHSGYLFEIAQTIDVIGKFEKGPLETLADYEYAEQFGAKIISVHGRNEDWKIPLRNISDVIKLAEQVGRTINVDEAKQLLLVVAEESARSEARLPGGQPGTPADDAGLCVTGDTLLPIVRSAEDGSKRTEEIPIVQVKPGDLVLSLNEATEQIEPHRINALLDMGIKPVYRLTTASGKSIKTTANHPYLVKGRAGGREKANQWVKVSELQAGDEIAAPNRTYGKLLANGKSSQFFGLRMTRRPEKEGGWAKSFSNEVISASGSFCGILSQITENIFSRVNSQKSQSLVTRTHFSFLDKEAKEKSDEDRRAILTSYPFAFKKRASSTRTFSSRRNRGLGIDNDVILPGQRAGIFQSRSDVFRGKGRKSFADALNTFTHGEHLQNLPDHNARAAKRGFSMADLGVSHDVRVDQNPFHRLFHVRKYNTAEKRLPTVSWVKVSELKLGSEIAAAKQELAGQTRLFKPNEVTPGHFYILGDFFDQALTNVFAFMHRYDRGPPIRMAHVDMASLLTNFLKPQLGKNAENLNGFERGKPGQQATLISWSPMNLSGLGILFSALTQSLIASLMRFKSFAMSRAWVWQPRKEGQEPISQPSSSSSIRTIYPSSFIGFSLLQKYITAQSVLPNLFSIPEAHAGEVSSDILWDAIVSIEPLGLEHVYDIEVDGTHNFIGNGIFAHNTYISRRSEARKTIYTISVPAGEDEVMDHLLILDVKAAPKWGGEKNFTYAVENAPRVRDEILELVGKERNIVDRKLDDQDRLILSLSDRSQIIVTEEGDIGIMPAPPRKRREVPPHYGIAFTKGDNHLLVWKVHPRDSKESIRFEVPNPQKVYREINQFLKLNNNARIVAYRMQESGYLQHLILTASDSSLIRVTNNGDVRIFRSETRDKSEEEWDERIKGPDSAFKDRKLEDYEKRLGPEFKRSLNLLIERLKADPSAEVLILDIGAAYGAVLRKLKEEMVQQGVNPDRIQAIGINRTRFTDERAIEHFRAAGADQVVGNVWKGLPVADGSVDFAMAVEVPVPKTALQMEYLIRELGRILAPGGIVFYQLDPDSYKYYRGRRSRITKDLGKDLGLNISFLRSGKFRAISLHRSEARRQKPEEVVEEIRRSGARIGDKLQHLQAMYPELMTVDKRRDIQERLDYLINSRDDQDLLDSVAGILSRILNDIPEAQPFKEVHGQIQGYVDQLSRSKARETGKEKSIKANARINRALDILEHTLLRDIQAIQRGNKRSTDPELSEKERHLKQIIAQQTGIDASKLNLQDLKYSGLLYQKSGSNKDVFEVLFILGEKQIAITLALKSENEEGGRILPLEIDRIKALNEQTEFDGSMAPIFIGDYLDPSGSLITYFEEWIYGPTVFEAYRAGGLLEPQIQRIAEKWVRAGRVLSRDGDYSRFPSDIHAENIMFRSNDLEKAELVVVDLGGVKDMTPGLFIDRFIDYYIVGKTPGRSVPAAVGFKSALEAMLFGIYEGFDSDVDKTKEFLSMALDDKNVSATTARIINDFLDLLDPPGARPPSRSEARALESEVAEGIADRFLKEVNLLEVGRLAPADDALARNISRLISAKSESQVGQIIQNIRNQVIERVNRVIQEKRTLFADQNVIRKAAGALLEFFTGREIESVTVSQMTEALGSATNLSISDDEPVQVFLQRIRDSITVTTSGLLTAGTVLVNEFDNPVLVARAEQVYDAFLEASPNENIVVGFQMTDWILEAKENRAELLKQTVEAIKKALSQRQNLYARIGASGPQSTITEIMRLRNSGLNRGDLELQQRFKVTKASVLTAAPQELTILATPDPTVQPGVVSQIHLGVFGDGTPVDARDDTSMGAKFFMATLIAAALSDEVDDLIEVKNGIQYVRSQQALAIVGLVLRMMLAEKAQARVARAA